MHLFKSTETMLPVSPKGLKGNHDEKINLLYAAKNAVKNLAQVEDADKRFSGYISAATTALTAVCMLRD